MVTAKTEHFNVQRAYHIYNNLIRFSTQFRNEQAKDENIKATKSQFGKYLEAMEPDPVNTVSVTYAKHTNKLGKGRLFAQGPSLQGMIREIRDSILTYDNGTDMAWDIDIVNCHPVLLLALMKSRNIAHATLEDYTLNRDAKLRDIMTTCNMTKEEAKKLVLAIINGGSVCKNPPEWLLKLEIEIIDISEDIMDENPALTKEVRARKKRDNKSTSNLKGSILNIELCDMESKCIESAEQMLQHSSYTPMVTIFDGMMVKREANCPIKLPDALFEALSSYVRDETGYDVRFIQKPLAHKLQCDDWPIDLERPMKLSNQMWIVSSDAEAGRKVLEQRGGRWAYDGKRIFEQNPIGVWEEKDPMLVKQGFKTMLARQEIRIAFLSKRGDTDPHYYAQNTHIEALASTCLDILRTEADVAAEFEKTRRSFLFLNGYVNGDDTKRQLHPLTDDMKFDKIIRRNYTSTRNSALSQEIFERGFDTMFINKDTRDCLMTYLARGLMFETEEKAYAFAIGARCCGKGTLQTLMKNAFGDYVGEFEASELVQKKVSGNEKSRQFAFMSNFDRVPLMFSQEVDFDASKGEKLNGNTLKKIAGGGRDSITTRGVYEKEKTFKPVSRMIMCANSMPQIEPRDALETLLLFAFECKFVSKIGPEEEAKNAAGRFKYILKDPKINEFYDREDVAMETFHMILDSYRDSDDYVTQDVKDEATTCDVVVDPKEAFMELLKFTNDKLDVMTMKQLFSLAIDEDIKVSATDIKQMLKPVVAFKQQLSTKYDRAPGFVGLRLQRE